MAEVDLLPLLGLRQDVINAFTGFMSKPPAERREIVGEKAKDIGTSLRDMFGEIGQEARRSPFDFIRREGLGAIAFGGAGIIKKFPTKQSLIKKTIQQAITEQKVVSRSKLVDRLTDQGLSGNQIDQILIHMNRGLAIPENLLVPKSKVKEKTLGEVIPFKKPE